MLTQEYGTGACVATSDTRPAWTHLTPPIRAASNIKSRVNRLSVLAAITSTQQRLKLYSKVPPNGLVIYCGTILTDEGKEKKVNFDFEPFKVSSLADSYSRLKAGTDPRCLFCSPSTRERFATPPLATV